MYGNFHLTERDWGDLGVGLLLMVSGCGWLWIIWHQSRTIRLDRRLVCDLEVAMGALGGEEKAMRIERNFSHPEALVSAYNAMVDRVESRLNGNNLSWTSLLPENFAHEVRTPLSAILGYTDLLLEEKALSTEARSLANAMEKSGERLLWTINNLSEYACLREGGIQDRREETNLVQLFQYVYEEIGVALAEKGLEVFIDWVGPTAEVVLVDKSRLALILINLMRNHVGWTDSGGARIYFETHFTGGKDEGELSILIEDTGRGISEAERHLLFTGKAAPSSRGLFGSSALNLDLSIRLCRSMGGSLTECGHATEGSCFVLSVPVTRIGLEVLPSQQTNCFCKDKVFVLLSQNELSKRVIGEHLEKGGLAAYSGDSSVDLILVELPGWRDKKFEAQMRRTLEAHSKAAILIIGGGFNPPLTLGEERRHLQIVKPLCSYDLICGVNTLLSPSSSDLKS